MYYGDKREAKVNIMAELVNRGWKVYGYTPDESDSMQDIYSPSHWDGIATKNDYVLVIDNDNTHYSGYEVKQYDYSKQRNNYKTNDKIAKLTAMMNDAASTENEKASCAVLIEREQEKLGVKPSYIVKETYPTFQYGNPKSCSFHIEKDGQIIAKGTGVFACYVGNDHYEPNKSERITKVAAFVDRLEAAIKQDGALESEVIKVPKTVIKPVEIDTKELTANQVNDDTYFIMKVSYTNGNGKGTMYKCERASTIANSDTFVFSKLGKNLKPSKSRGSSWYQSIADLNNKLAKGHIAIVEMKEFVEWESKTVYKKTAKKQKQNFDIPAIAGDVQEVSEEATAETNNNRNIIEGRATININEVKNGIEIKFTEKPSQNVIGALKENGFRWFQPLGFWCAKQTAERLKFAQMLIETYNSIIQEEPETIEPETVAEAQEVTQQPTQEQQGEVNPYAFNIDLNYTYHNIHFKAWNDSIETLTKLLDHQHINYYIAGEKFICTGLTVDDVAWIEVVNKENGAIIFYDDKYNEKPENIHQEDVPQPEQEKELITETIIINGKIKVKEITFEWSESSMIKDNLTVSTFAEAEESVRLIASNVRGGYDKTKFIITWTDGDTYAGRLDVEKEDEKKHTPIKDHITDWLLFLTGDKKPSHMSEKQYQAHIVKDEEEKQQYYEFLERYALTDLEETCNNSITDEQQESHENDTETAEPDNVVYYNFGNVGAQKEEKETDTTRTFDDLISKFDDIEITAESKVSADDSEFCKEQEAIYKKLVEVHNSFIDQLQPFFEIDKEHGQKYKYQTNEYTHKYDTAYYQSLKPTDINKTIENMKNKFVSTICYYFMKKYNVTIEHEKIQKKYDSNVTYDNIIDEIYIQLDGHNFTEKAEQEIKTKSKEAVRNSDRITIKNSKLIIDGRFAYHDSIWKEYRLSGGFSEVFKGLQHFEDGTTAGNSELIGKYCGYQNERNAANYERYEPMTMNKVKSIKFLKNGKLEIEFKSNQQAAKFAQEYCGYTQKSA